MLNPSETQKKLRLAKNVTLSPDAIIGAGNGLCGIGMPGSGKTTLLAMLLEQFGTCDIPFVAFDLEGDLAPVTTVVPRGVVATASKCPTPEQIYQKGLQVVYDLDSFDDPVALICSVCDALLQIARKSVKKVPLIIALDEAAYFVPLHAGTKKYFSRDQFQDLYTTFSTMSLRGRKQGLSLFLFTQRFAHLNKDVLVGSATYIIMRQTTAVDLDTCMEYISKDAWKDGDDLTINQVKARIASFKRGQGVIKMSNGRQAVIQFNNRVSEHISNAPGTQSAIDAFSGTTVDDADFAPWNSEEELLDCSALTSLDDQGKARTATPTKGTIKARVFQTLDQDPTTGSRRLAELIGAPQNTCQLYRTEYFVQHPEHRHVLQAQHPGSQMETLVRGFLDQDSTLTPSQLAHRTNYNVRDIRKVLARIEARKAGATQGGEK